MLLWKLNLWSQNLRQSASDKPGVVQAPDPARMNWTGVVR